MGVCDVIKESFDVRLDQPLRALDRDDFRHAFQRLMRVAPAPCANMKCDTTL
jgi:hypothetical protein